jgi:four helix bundle protein
MIQYFKTRQWKHPEGYKYLVPWTNAILLRFLIRKFTETLPRSEHRAKTQLDDAGRSIVSNIEEGYKRPTTKEYLDFIGFSQGSLEEIKGLIRQVHQDGFLKSKPGSTLADLDIDLKEVKGLLKETKGNTSLNLLYHPLSSLKGTDLTLEIFMELINKTDYLLRGLVKSLEKKMSEEMPMSPRERWLKARAIKQLEEDKKFDEEVRKSLDSPNPP